MLSDEYLVLTSVGESLFKDKGSKFFGYAYPVTSEEEIKRVLEEIKSVHPKARHFCYAYRLGEEGEIFRANDDGEPSGSAGKPILNVILSAGLSFTLVVVVRYFGGTLLGVPGLINAYKSSAKEALEASEKEIRTKNVILKILYGFNDTNVVMQLVKKLDLRILEQTFDQKCGLVLEVRLGHIDLIKEGLVDHWEVEVIE